jgi:hypothetical protein
MALNNGNHIMRTAASTAVLLMAGSRLSAKYRPGTPVSTDTEILTERFPDFPKGYIAYRRGGERQRAAAATR